MKIFDFFKKKKKAEVLKEETKIIEEVKLTPNQLHTVSANQFSKEIKKYFKLALYGFGIAANETSRIYIGDITDAMDIDFKGHLLVVGNISKTWINLHSSTHEDGGSLFVTGDVMGDYFSNYYSKLVMINGSLIIKKIINTEFEDACLVVKNNLKTEYYHGIDIGADVSGTIDITYGWGYCNNKDMYVIQPKHNLEDSLKFLNTTENCDSELINDIIKKKIEEDKKN